ncbi:hypothetical protein C8A01DRAFT_40859 [Parachaetomium inaequale]|uniref:Uncharacterized protein n=1 Tax=Parachaetomium inaequale TaxID=2588326 RepID=A0AAN6P6J2_9PEZI|nr:hypothetical protein C8A01DRAFT_40859 [Parachaetomium inaequale]
MSPNARKPPSTGPSRDPNPYRQGQTMRIHSHTPPRPYRACYGNVDAVRKPVRGLVDISGRPNIDHSCFVFSNPPLETEPPAQAKAHELTIVGEVSHTPKEKGGGPRLVSYYLDSDKAHCYVAEIYDALEYRLANAGDGG